MYVPPSRPRDRTSSTREIPQVMFFLFYVCRIFVLSFFFAKGSILPNLANVLLSSAFFPLLVLLTSQVARACFASSPSRDDARFHPSGLAALPPPRLSIEKRISAFPPIGPRLSEAAEFSYLVPSDQRLTRVDLEVRPRTSRGGRRKHDTD